MPLWLMDQTMPEAELWTWRHYRAKRDFPIRRIEKGLALIALMITRVVGKVEGVTLKDFLFDPADDDPKNRLEAAKAAFGFSPRNVKKKRRANG